MKARVVGETVYPNLKLFLSVVLVTAPASTPLRDLSRPLHITRTTDL